MFVNGGFSGDLNLAQDVDADNCGLTALQQKEQPTESAKSFIDITLSELNTKPIDFRPSDQSLNAIERHPISFHDYLRQS